MTRYESIIPAIAAAVFTAVFALGTLFQSVHAASTTPSILDSLPLTERAVNAAMSHSFSYTVPSGGTNKLLIMLMGKDSCDIPNPAPAATLNGSALTIFKVAGFSNRACYYVGYLPAPSTGTFSVSFSDSTFARYYVMTLQDAAQSDPIDTHAVMNNQSTQTTTTTLMTNLGNDLLLSLAFTYVQAGPFTSFGGQSTYYNDSSSNGMGWQGGAYKAAASIAGAESMSVTVTGTSDFDADLAVIAVKPVSCGSSDSGGITITICNSGTIINLTTARSSTGGNTAVGSHGGNGGAGGEIIASGKSGDENNGGASGGSGGGGGSGGSGAVIQTGNATSNASTTNAANRAVVRFR